MTAPPPPSPAPDQASEPRWPLALTILAVMGVTLSLPDHLQFLPSALCYALCLVAVLVMILVTRTPGHLRLLRLEDGILTLLAVLLIGSCVLTLRALIDSIVGGTSPIGGVRLLTSSVAVWVNNILAFSVLYWVTDRGGAEGRRHDAGRAPDWLFPQMVETQLAPPGWLPGFVDYLSLGFWTATAFSPADIAPLTPRAKLLMMLQASISLVTLAVVASRAINVLGS